MAAIDLVDSPPLNSNVVFQDAPMDKLSSSSSGSLDAAVRARQAKEERTPLRFYLVREGNKFVAVARNRRRKAWRELNALAPSRGVPVVLDPSPYQVK